jgi:transcriptional accessory protein Tex/SPT6
MWNILVELIEGYSVDFISLENGMALKEINTFMTSILKKKYNLNWKILIINECVINVAEISDSKR